MKTALQELIEIIKDKRKESDISNTLLRFCQIEAEKLLEKEKQQLKETWNDGFMTMSWDKMVSDKREDYFNETFGDKVEEDVP